MMAAFLFMAPFETNCQNFVFDQDVPYVPTPVRVVEEMLAMAEVGSDDILYDLGCGDGRIIIMAAEKFGIRGVGFDIDPQRIAESRKNAYNANVIGNVRFYEKDMFRADISEATVLTLYLLTSVNLKLRPKILRELLPGTRVVSHNYGMGDWKPDQSKEIDSHTVNFWVVPANFSGTWEWRIGDPPDEKHSVVKLDQLFQHVRGYVDLKFSKLPITGVNVTGSDVRFTIEETMNGVAVTMQYEGTIDGDMIEGTVTAVSGKSGRDSYETDWQATRIPSTMMPLDE